MNKIDTEKWMDFEISKLFIIKSPASRSIKTYNNGDVAYVSSGSVNNGICSYLEPKEDEKLEKGNCITVSPLDGSSFYQENDFLGRGGAGSAISLLYGDFLTKYSALFISTIIKISAKKFDYSDALTSDNLKTLKIKLPIIYNKDGSAFIDKEKNFSNEGYVPDWNFMINYMKGIEKNAKKRLDVLTILGK